MYKSLFHSNILIILEISSFTLINCEVEVDLSWVKDFILVELNIRITGINFIIANTKLYVPIVTLYINDNNNFSKNIKQAFKKEIH